MPATPLSRRFNRQRLRGGCDVRKPDFPTQNPEQPDHANDGGLRDAFGSPSSILAGDALVYSTYLGGNSSDDEGVGIALDSADNAYVIGTTDSRMIFPPQMARICCNRSRASRTFL